MSTPPPATPTINGQTNGAAKEVTNTEDGAKSIMEETVTKDTRKEKKAKKRKSTDTTVCSDIVSLSMGSEVACGRLKVPL
jgi:hypothetical protein